MIPVRIDCLPRGGPASIESASDMSQPDSSQPDERTAALIRGALGELPRELREDATRWIEGARAASAAEVERDLVSESRDALDRFRAAVAAVERMIAG